MSDVVSEMWAAAKERFALDTAESRAACDRFLISELQKIEDEMVRKHAAAMVRDIRSQELINRDHTMTKIFSKLADLDHRLRKAGL